MDRQRLLDLFGIIRRVDSFRESSRGTFDLMRRIEEGEKSKERSRQKSNQIDEPKQRVLSKRARFLPSTRANKQLTGSSSVLVWTVVSISKHSAHTRDVHVEDTSLCEILVLSHETLIGSSGSS